MDKTYGEIADYFNDNFAYFCTHVLNLGKPEYTNSIGTAAVAVTTEGKDKYLNFTFLFNKDFLDSFEHTEQKAFIFAHETMHVLLSHLKLAPTFVDFPLVKKLSKQYEAKGLDKTELAQLLVEKKKMECFNVAADCVINDYLIRDGFVPPEQLCLGVPIVGHNCADYTVREVYNELISKFADQDSMPEQGGKIDEHDWLFEAAEKAVEAAEKLYEELQGKGDIPADLDNVKSLQGGKQYSLTASDVEQKFIEQHGISLAWLALLKKLNPDVFRQLGLGPPKQASFHKARRKLAAFPTTRLPVKRVDKRREGEVDEVPAMVLALDTSGSIATEDRNKFITLAKSVPQDKIKLFCITFTTQFNVLDLENIRYNTGGTDFSAIQRYVNDRVVPVLKHYPRSIVVITDGYANFSEVGLKPTEQELKSWYWLLTQNGSMMYINKMGVRDWSKKIDEFVKHA